MDGIIKAMQNFGVSAHDATQALNNFITVYASADTIEKYTKEYNSLFPAKSVLSRKESLKWIKGLGYLN